MEISRPACHRRRHAPEFKQQLVGLCRPGVSTAAVALAHGVNANLLRRWIRLYSGALPVQQVSAPPRLVAVQVEAPADAPVDDVIEIAIQKNNTRINIRWPGNRSDTCGQWLEEWIK